MKKILTLIILAMTTAAVMAQKPADLNKTVVNVIAYDANGNVIHNAYGFLIGTEGDIVVPFTALKGAASATVVNWQGTTAPVQRIKGASSEYDIVCATTGIATKKLISLTPASTHATKGQQMQLAFYSNDKKSMPLATAISVADSYDGHYYYEVTAPNETKYFGCPIVDAEGHVCAIVQENLQKDAQTACAIDINFATDFSINSTSIFNADLNAIHIPKHMAFDNEEDAYSYVFMLMHAQKDSAIVIPTTDDFIAAFPANTKIYADRASFYASLGQYANADAEIQKGIANGGKDLSEVYNTLSLLSYGKVLAGGEDPYPSWTLDTALDAAEKAYEAQPLPIYLLQKGQVLFSQLKYAEAYEAFTAVNNTEIASPQTFYYAYNALDHINGDESQLIALLDSVIAHLPKPYTDEAWPYFIARAQRLEGAGQYRRAVADYNECEKILGHHNLKSQFYWLRSQAELGCHMNEQALDDLATAANIAEDKKEKIEFLIEEAALRCQWRDVDMCIQTCESILALDAAYADAYKLLGICYGEKKDKKRAQQYLKKAQENGATNVEQFIEQYK